PPGEGLKFFPGPRAVVVLFLEAFVFIHGEQNKGFLGPWIDDARWGGVGVFQSLRLLFGEFNHGCLLSSTVPRRYAPDHLMRTACLCYPATSSGASTASVSSTGTSLSWCSHHTSASRLPRRQ